MVFVRNKWGTPHGCTPKFWILNFMRFETTVFNISKPNQDMPSADRGERNRSARNRLR